MTNIDSHMFTNRQHRAILNDGVYQSCIDSVKLSCAVTGQPQQNLNCYFETILKVMEILMIPEIVSFFVQFTENVVNDNCVFVWYVYFKLFCDIISSFFSFFDFMK